MSSFRGKYFFAHPFLTKQARNHGKASNGIRGNCELLKIQ